MSAAYKWLGDPRNDIIGEPLCKGTALIAALDFAKTKWGKTWAEVVANRNAASVKALAQPVLASKWYPTPTYVTLLESICAGSASQSAHEISAELARFEVERDFGQGIYRSLLSVASPAFLLRMSANIWSIYSKTGKLYVVADGPRAANLQLCGFAVPSAIFYANLMDFTRELVSLAGAENVQSFLLDGGSSSDNFIEFHLTWENF
jgi:hypothetical protein